MKILAIVAAFAAWSATAAAQENGNTQPSFWKDGWFVQTGIDASLQNPYGHDFTNTLDEGMSWGVDVALGRRFTPELGLRAKVNWENGIGLLGKNKAGWLAPFDEPGANMDKGGYVCLVGDILLDVKNLFSRDVRCDREWTAYVFPRAGFVYNLGVSKGSPLAGAGVGASRRIGNRLKMYGDVAYNMVSSGFTGVEKGTGVGSNSNGFFDINIGVQCDLGAGTATSRMHRDAAGKSRFWHSGWFLQGGADMSLVNPYGGNFANVFPKGWTVGAWAAAGKWFSSEIGIRARGKWDNGIVANSKLEWIGPLGDDGLSTNHDGGGFMAVNGDVLLSLTGIFASDADSNSGYGRQWNVYVFPRAGLLSNRATGSGSPLVGIGAGATCRLNERWSIVGDAAYQVSTSEFFAAKSGTGMTVSAGCNGFFDVCVGIQYDL